MTDINRSSLLAKLKHIKGMKLLVEQAVLLYLLMTAYSHAWRSLNNIHADHSITSMPIAQ